MRDPASREPAARCWRSRGRACLDRRREHRSFAAPWLLEQEGIVTERHCVESEPTVEAAKRAGQRGACARRLSGAQGLVRSPEAVAAVLDALRCRTGVVDAARCARRAGAESLSVQAAGRLAEGGGERRGRRAASEAGVGVRARGYESEYLYEERAARNGRKKGPRKAETSTSARAGLWPERRRRERARPPRPLALCLGPARRRLASRTPAQPARTTDPASAASGPSPRRAASPD